MAGWRDGKSSFEEYKVTDMIPKTERAKWSTPRVSAMSL